MAATYYWLPKFTGNMYSEKWGKIHFWLSAIFVNVLFFPQHYLGLAGMPRRIPDYSPQFADFTHDFLQLADLPLVSPNLFLSASLSIVFSEARLKPQQRSGTIQLDWNGLWNHHLPTIVSARLRL